MKVFITLLGVGIVGAFFAPIYINLGSSPSAEKQVFFAQSENFNSQSNQFVNRKRGLIEAMWKRNLNIATFLDFLKPHKNTKPNHVLPQVKPNLETFLNSKESLKVIWFGHSSFLLHMGGKVTLVDPMFSHSASPEGFLVKRFQPPILSLEELPNIDYILISHDHYDHLDRKSVEYFKNKEVTFITPLGVGSHLEYWGIAKEKIVERDWWESVEFDGIQFIATPAQHFSGRGIRDRNKTLWASWVLLSDQHRVYFSGDSGYDTHFKDIGNKFGPFDIAFLENGQYNEKWPEVHLFPEDAIRAYKDLKAKRYFPIHWGMFVLSTHTWSDPIERLFSLADKENVHVIVPKIGQIVDLSGKLINERWWD